METTMATEQLPELTEEQKKAQSLIWPMIDQNQRVVEAHKAPDRVKLDLGCGNNKFPGYWGVDELKLDAVDQVVDLFKLNVKGELAEVRELDRADWHLFDCYEPWPWADSSVDDIYCGHVLEHLYASERVHFFNECWRILKPGEVLRVETPHWCSCRAYGDLDHKWPAVSEQFFASLAASWRGKHQPHLLDAFRCNFDVNTSCKLNEQLLNKNEAFRNEAVNWFKEAAADLIADCHCVK
jgi:SAM-dependent methyltransferase